MASERYGNINYEITVDMAEIIEKFPSIGGHDDAIAFFKQCIVAV